MDRENEENLFVHLESGEIVREKKYLKGQNFVKMYKKNMIKMLEVAGGKKVKVLIYILENLHLSNNTLIKTQKEIAEDCEVSLKTVNVTMRDLEQKGILKKRAGSFMLSPDLFFRGDEQKKQGMLNDFRFFNSITMKNNDGLIVDDNTPTHK